jgi:hypothetical protein
MRWCATGSVEGVGWLEAWGASLIGALITTLVAHDVSGGDSFIAAWVTIKMLVGWQRWAEGTQYVRAAACMALLGNAVSFLLGLAGGILCQENSR